jgi:hypothetical protein
MVNCAVAALQQENVITERLINPWAAFAGQGGATGRADGFNRADV